MKTILKVMLPMAAFALASAGAVSTNVSKESVADKPAITGFIQNGSITNCPSRSVDCTTVNTGQTCMSSDATPKRVWLKNGLDQCVIDLYKVIH